MGAGKATTLAIIEMVVVVIEIGNLPVIYKVVEAVLGGAAVTTWV